eukprot:TRINITY_DN34140_c0_g1_i1.p2 TRINITY_DN34140_c0_g1~~TRINITY_DN34140_c0_g1_i1.p2  ORF type:complete len:138 (-),score=44.04 TRINITY_DN34140_c0_g1_i1:80-493(-)
MVRMVDVVFFFKQKTAYEMQRGLVGSEMCIRDRVSTQSTWGRKNEKKREKNKKKGSQREETHERDNHKKTPGESNGTTQSREGRGDGKMKRKKRKTDNRQEATRPQMKKVKLNDKREGKTRKIIQWYNGLKLSLIHI